MRARWPFASKMNGSAAGRAQAERPCSNLRALLGPLSAVGLALALTSCTRSAGLESGLDGTWDMNLSCLTNRQIVVQINGETSTWEDTDTSTSCVVTRTIRISHVSNKLIRMTEAELPTCSTPGCSAFCTDTSELADWTYDLADSTSGESFTLTAKFTGKGYEKEGTCAVTPLNTTTFTIRR